MADAQTEIPDDDIRLRSYLIWRQEGCPNGRALAHWLQAKAELETERRHDGSGKKKRSKLSKARPRVYDKKSNP